MSPIAITLILLLVAIVLFASEKLPVDVIGILLVMGLILTRVLTVHEAVAGFGNDIIITIGGLFILVGGLIKTGMVDMLGRRMHKMAGDSEFILTALIMLAAAIGASVLKNTTTTAMFLPVVVGLAAKAKIPPSKLLMPLAFGAILGGSCTLIGTSTNLAVSGAIQRYGQAPFSMFELAPVGIITFSVGMIYMLLIGRRMLPSRGGEESFTEQYNIRDYISELIVLPDSPLVGKTLDEAGINTELQLTILGIVRDGERISAPGSSERIQRRDSLIVEGKVSDILRVKEAVGLEIKPDILLNDVDLESEDVELFELLVMRDSRLVGQSLKGLRFRQTYDLTVLAVNRHGETFVNKLSDVRFIFGDVLLVQGKRDGIEPLVDDREVLLLDDVSDATVRVEKRKWAMAAFGLFLALSLTKVTIGFDVPLAVCVLAGVMVLLATKTVRYSEMYSLIDFRLLVLIACMMSFGVAMENTKADIYLASLINEHFAQYGSNAVLAGFFILTVALTQPMSNQAAALVVLPVAVKAAIALGVNPRTFIVAVTYAASFSFITPLEPACVLVYTPGRYRFMDFVKVGTILTIIVFFVSIVMVPIFWPL
ncbi:MAG TPA: SLC13 family permease [Pyrinomonadaceae bacterium]|nr:SLC13 family permease [Chloracidobacterium sp.]MBP9935770.1 SLC13 family permease [Pyrinomonadaceae bacterium]MBK7801278.1 SLC13 family permease [Chloracidobacterium sp.]MBK9436598.1 SLC13 family permease [Chloracidobacterium sp.]MBK9767494.1 SLC13 family permease [Chloracidobacterium sp.]